MRRDPGIECWDALNVEDLGGKDFACPSCNTFDPWKKEHDTLDVWFDSGISHYAVLKQNKDLAYPADIYIEAQDQYRGWFQSSLLTAMVLEKAPCMKTILTHGFTVDEKGRKMSKSLGNYVPPDDIIAKLGVDGLRVWVSSVDVSGDIVVSDASLNNALEVFRKIRNTARFLISNLYDFDFDKDAVALDELRPIDVYALQQLYELNRLVIRSYDEHDYSQIFHALANYCTAELSAFYLDIIKDRLYVEKADGHARRSAQSVCWYILDTLTKLIAPILSITAEQLSDLYQKDKQESIHLSTFNALPNPWSILGTEQAVSRAELDLAAAQRVYSHDVIMKEVSKTSYIIKQEQYWMALTQMRSALLKAIEGKRETGMIKHSLEARVIINYDLENDAMQAIDEFFKNLKDQTAQEFLKEFLIVSQIEFVTDKGELEPTIMKGLSASVEQARGTKCPRCWQWEETKNKYGLCKRCAAIVKK